MKMKPRNNDIISAYRKAENEIFEMVRRKKIMKFIRWTITGICAFIIVTLNVFCALRKMWWLAPNFIFCYCLLIIEVMLNKMIDDQ